MERVLVVFRNAMNGGGAETFMMKIYRKLDKTKFQMDFCVGSEEKGFFDDEIESYGGKIYYVIPKSKNLKKHFVELKKLVKEQRYKKVINVATHSLSTLDLLAAKIGGAKKLIMRATNANIIGRKSQIMHYCFRWMTNILACVKIAPSTEAAEYTFGKNQVKKGKVHILNNGIPVEKFLFSDEKRELKRKELGLENKFVVGHVGRFMTQKNHMYLLEVFRAIKNRIPNAVLVLVGDGELRQNVECRVKELELEESVIFLGVRSDVPELFMAMDIKIFPSFFEGMPNTIIEAQGTGLPCIISDTITREADITGLVTYMSIEESPEIWAEKCVEIKEKNEERRNTKDDFIKAQYDIDSVVARFVGLVF